MYSGITKIYYKKTARHVFTKPIQIEGTTQTFPPPTVSCFSSSFTFLPLGDASVGSEKMAAPEEKSFCVLEYHTVSLWLLCNVHFVQSTQSNIATWPRWPKATDHWSSEEYRCTNVEACVARTWISYRCVPCHRWCTHRTSLVVKKKTFSVFPWLWTIPLR